MSPVIASMVLETFRRLRPRGQMATLSEREIQVLQLLAEGKPRKEVADELHLSRHTINNHVRHIYEKLHVHNLSSALKKAVEGGLI